MFKKIFILYVIMCIGVVSVGCNPKSGFIYEMNVGNAVGQAIKVDIVGFGTELDETGKEVIAAILNINITNIGEQSIELENDIAITALQGTTEATLISNTIIEGSRLEPQDIGNYEVSFKFRGSGDVRVNFKVDNQTEGFIITTNYPAEIIGGK